MDLEPWTSLSDQVQRDLLAWYNQSPVDERDFLLLADLYHAGLFHAWDCPLCGERVYVGEPDDWSAFQGVDQADYVSYPGDVEVFMPEMRRLMCDECRMHGLLPVQTRETY